MEEPLSFVRDNPFVKNDGCKRLFRRNPIVEKPISRADVSQVPEQLSYSVKKAMIVDKESDDLHDNLSIGSSSDIEYGPGIVEKLKAKFYQLSGIASRDAKVSPHATGKRCPSMDDILSTTEQQPSTWTYHPEEFTQMHKAHSKSMGDVFDQPGIAAEKRSLQVHRVVKIGDEDEDDTTDARTISVLRQKFEQNVQRRPSQNRRDFNFLEVKKDRPARPKSVDLSEQEFTVREIPTKSFTVVQSMESCSCQIPISCCQHVESVDSYRTAPAFRAPSTSLIEVPSLEKPPARITRKEPAQLRVLEVLNQTESYEEPEFVKIGRRLKRSPLHLDDMPEKIELKKDIQELDDSTISVSSRSSKENSIERGVVYRSYDPAPYTRPPGPKEEVQLEEPKQYLIRGKPEIPTLSINAKIIREDDVSRSYDVYSPPDPEPAHVKSHEVDNAVFITTTSEVIHSASSSPPEEPRHRIKTEQIQQAIVSPVSRNSVTSPCCFESDNRATVQEMLNRFQKSRDSRMIDFGGHSRDELEKEKTADISISSVPRQQQQAQTQRSFVPTLVGVRSSEESKTASTSTITFSSVASNKCNVISISVSPENEDASSICSSAASSSCGSLVRRMSDDEENGISPVAVSVVSSKKPAPAVPTDLPPAVPTTPPPSIPSYNAISSSTSSLQEESTVSATSVSYSSVISPGSPAVTERPNVLPVIEDLPEDQSNKSVDYSSVLNTPGNSADGRKSLSSRYLEEKFKQYSTLSSVKPYGDDATELKSEVEDTTIEDEVILHDESASTYSLPHIENQLANFSQFLQDSDGFSSDSDSDDLHGSSHMYEVNPSSTFKEPIRAGDGNLVRQSLLEIVMKEDIPLILQAMNEKFTYEFENLEATATTSSIIHPPEKRQQRRKERNVSRIKFAENKPVVYTYLNENDAVATPDWLYGAEMQYDDYQCLFFPRVDEYPPSTPWRTSTTTSSLVESFMEGDDEDYSLDLTSSVLQAANRENPTISV